MTHPRAAARRTILQSRYVTVEVGCPSGDDIAWLEDFLGPAFRPCQAPVDVHYSVDATTDEQLFDTYANARPPATAPDAVAFVLDQRILTTPYWPSPSNGRPVFFDAAHHSLYLTDARPGVTVVTRAGGRLFRGAVMRIVRELAMARAWTRTSAVLHASGFAGLQGAVVMTGPKRSGKTSLLLHCLHASGTAFLANDRIVLVDEGQRFTAQGMPSLVSLRHSTIGLFPRLAETLSARRYRAHLTPGEMAAMPAATRSDLDGAISPSQLCHAIDVPMAEAAPLAAVLLPRVDLSSRGLRIEAVAPDLVRGRFDDVIFAASAGGRTSEVFRTRDSDTLVDTARARDLWLRAAGAVPVLDCRIGRGAFDESADATVLAIAEAAGLVARTSR